jgi:hypothetical protein
MKTFSEYKTEFDELTVELEAVKAMPEADAIRLYNVNNRSEIVTILEEELEAVVLLSINEFPGEYLTT